MGCSSGELHGSPVLPRTLCMLEIAAAVPSDCFFAHVYVFLQRVSLAETLYAQMDSVRTSVHVKL